MNATPEKICLCKKIAFVGIAVMGTGSFLACLAQNASAVTAGNALLLLGIAVSSYGFAYWRP